MKPHEAYSADDMPARKLAAWVGKGLKSGAGIEPVAIAKALFNVASRNDNVPLHLPLGGPSHALIKLKLEERLKNLETFKELGAIG